MAKSLGEIEGVFWGEYDQQEIQEQKHKKPRTMEKISIATDIIFGITVVFFVIAIAINLLAVETFFVLNEWMQIVFLVSLFLIIISIILKFLSEAYLAKKQI